MTRESISAVSDSWAQHMLLLLLSHMFQWWNRLSRSPLKTWDLFFDNVHNVVDYRLAKVPFGTKTCLPANSWTQSDTGTQRHHQLQPHPMVLWSSRQNVKLLTKTCSIDKEVVAHMEPSSGSCDPAIKQEICVLKRGTLYSHNWNFIQRKKFKEC